MASPIYDIRRKKRRNRVLTGRSLPRSVLAASLLALVLAAACHADDIAAIGQGRHLEVSVGDRFDVLLRAGALGSYKAPPTISAPAVEFLEATVVDESPVPPGGPLQRFRFRAAGPGTAVITFTPAQVGPAASDTVVVR
jgi:hypothetical protein